MRINAITNWAYGVTVLLTVISGTAFILSSRSADVERRSVEEHLGLDTLAEELALGAEVRTDEARLYVMRGDERHLIAFRATEEAETRLENTIGDVKRLEITPQEFEILQKIQADADALDKVEVAAVSAYQGGDQAAAQEALFGPEHSRLHSDLMESVRRFRELTEARTATALKVAQEQSNIFGSVARVMLGMTAIVFIAVLYFVLKRRVANPLVRMTGIVARLAKQDYAVEVPRDSRRDEIGDLNEAIHIFRENGLERERLDAERRLDQTTKDLILQMMHRLQACQTQQELAEVVARFAPQIFPDLSGHLYILNDSRTLLTMVGTWLDPQHSSKIFCMSDCWALRRGRPHVSNRDHSDVTCQHLDESKMAGLCVPLTAQGDTIGLLYFEQREGHDPAPETSRLYLELIAENIGLAAANLQLREKLTNLAVRDSLTSLLNRRSLDEALNRFARDHADRPLVCCMIDIDHFKRFNDEFGHDAGDVVMQYVSQIMLDTVGALGKVYRFGGEEFALLLPGLAEGGGYSLAEKIRTAISAKPLSHRGRVLGFVSVSIGVASSPDDGSVSTILSHADAALLAAKSGGRNMTVLASGQTEAITSLVLNSDAD